MATVNSLYELGSYTDDFGIVYPHVPVKFGNDVDEATLNQLGYTLRLEKTPCSASPRSGFTLRHFVATFESGAKHKFPFDASNPGAYTTFYNGLIAVGAICIDLVGESHRILTQKELGQALTYKNTPYTDIPARADKTSYTYNYSSSILTNAISLTTPIETLPTALNTAQTGCLGQTSTEKGICSGSRLGIKPRHFIIEALSKATVAGVTSSGKVSRKAITVSGTPADLKACAVKLASAAYCLGYQGESIKNVQNLL